MRDPFAWSIPLGRLFGITIRVHLLFPFVILALILRAANTRAGAPVVEGLWIDAALALGLLFLSVLLHELGHSFAARGVGGDSTEVLLWPLGGLASVDIPSTPRAHFLVAAAGPAVNLVLCVGCGLLLWLLYGLQPPWSFLYFPARFSDGLMHLVAWNGSPVEVDPYGAPAFLARLFWANNTLFLFNLILVGFPFDIGRMLQSVLWHFLGYRQATLFVVFLGFVTMFVLVLYGIIENEVLALCLAGFVYFSCKQEWLILETGAEESLFGYDFSQGYTSLERDQPATAPPQKRLSWWQRWLQRRAARRLQREQETLLAEERRLDELLDKVQRLGINTLTDEERRFMKRVSDRYKNRR